MDVLGCAEGTGGHTHELAASTAASTDSAEETTKIVKNMHIIYCNMGKLTNHSTCHVVLIC